MRVLGISGSPRNAEISGTSKLVKTVLDATEMDYELISLKGKKISGCIACLRCVKDNVCKVEDDLQYLREKIVRADAYVIGAPNYFSGLNATTHALLERWYQFRHQEGNLLWGKLAVAVGVGGTAGHFVADAIEKFCSYNFIEVVARVSGQGAASCYYCGHGDTCKVGIPYFLHGEEAEVSEEARPDVMKQPAVIQAAVDAGKILGNRLREGHDRAQVTERMQQLMMHRMKEAL